MTLRSRAIRAGFFALAIPLIITTFSTDAHAQLNIGPIGGIESIGRTELPTGTTFGGTTVGGLSGITYNRNTNRFYALSDDAGNNGGAARYYELGIDLADGTLNNGDVTFSNVITLKTPGGTTFPFTPQFTIDPEGFALSPDGNSVWVTSEGYRTAANTQDPFIRRYDLAGNQTDQINLPSRYNIVGTPDGQGPANNVVFESLAFNASGNRLYTALEGGLLQEGGASGFNKPANSRIVAFDPTTGNRTAEYLYRTDGIIRQPNGSAFATQGLVDILFTSDTTFLALERSLTTDPNNQFPGGQTNEVRLYQVSLTGATDISGIDSLTDAVLPTITGVQKTLLFDFNTALFGGSQIRIDNLEALSFGPQLADGSYSLIVASDNNFAAAQTNQFFAFRVTPAVVPEAGTLPLIVSVGFSVLSVAIVLRRKRANG
jgi:3-phytase/alkaline phosphatase D